MVTSQFRGLKKNHGLGLNHLVVLFFLLVCLRVRDLKTISLVETPVVKYEMSYHIVSYFE